MFTDAEFRRLAAAGEPVVGDILSDGVALIGVKPRLEARSSLMATAGQRNQAKAFLKKAAEYVASAEDNLELERYTPAAGDAIHAGISAKDASVTVPTGSTNKGKDP